LLRCVRKDFGQEQVRQIIITVKGASKLVRLRKIRIPDTKLGKERVGCKLVCKCLDLFQLVNFKDGLAVFSFAPEDGNDEVIDRPYFFVEQFDFM
jgi:hypothetical protein